ncbi:hypothetical protein [Demequina sp. NBRC 110053]|uniref:hypothetical protein n=1 Tax=Demequina sp. NBRC 110053 TaxID=1570342 RepID=UPI000A02F069|nr:hypothetical protein [Demequina sp. NBRC 110053]
MRYAIDAAVALEIAAGTLAVDPAHQLVGPGRLRSDAMGILFAAVREGGLDDGQARGQLEALASLKMRLLNDRVSRAVAWKIAVSREWSDLVVAEYLAVASLQADALVALDPALAAGAEGVVDLAPVEALGRNSGR